MQEKFAIRKTLRKVAAVGTSLAMIGITVSGALAAGLGDYPSGYGFTKNRSSTIVAYGADSDMDAANDVAAGLPGAAATTVQTVTTPAGLQYGVASLGTMTAADLFIRGGSEELDIRDPLNATDNFGNTVEDNKLSTMKDSSIAISIGSTSGDYDFHEEVRFGANSANEPSPNFASLSSPSVETGLTYASNWGDDWKENIFVFMQDGSVGYYYVFDENLKAGNYLANSTTSEPVAINFLGQDLEIEAATSTSVTVNVGKTLRMKSGETASIDTGADTVTVTFTGASSSSQAEATVTGPKGTKTEIIDNNAAVSFGGVASRPLQVRVQDVFNDDGTQFDAATVIVGLCDIGEQGGCEARQTFSDTDNYVGEDENDPIWEWDIAGLTTGTSTQIRLGVRLSLGLDDDDEDENALVKHPLYQGDYLCLPNFYACVVFEKMTETDDSFRSYEITDEQKDLYVAAADTTAQVSNARVLTLKAKGNADTGFIAGSQDTDTIYVFINSTGIGPTSLNLYRKDTSSGRKAVLFASDSVADVGDLGTYVLNDQFQIDHGSTSINVDVLFDDNLTGAATGAVAEGVLVIDSPNNATAYTNLVATTGGSLQPFNATGLSGLTSFTNGLLGVLNDGDVVVYFVNSSPNQITYLGHSDADTTTANDLIYVHGSTLDNGATNARDISDLEENLRTAHGLLFFDPDARNSGDKTEFAVPSDVNDYEAVISVTSPKEGVVSTTGAASGSTSASVVVKDTDVMESYSTLNVVAVGGPCVNQVTAALLGVTFPACGESSGLGEGVATLSLKANGAKQALLVYGWEAEDTRRAAVLAKTPSELKQKLTAAGKESATEVSVKGVGLEVSGLTVA